MKAYTDYMNRVSGGDRLREKIMARVAVESCDIGYDRAITEDEAVTHIMSTLYVPPQLSDTGKIAERWISQDNLTAKSKRLKIATARLPQKTGKIKPRLIAMLSCAAVLVVAMFVVATTLNQPAVIIPDEEIAAAGSDSYVIDYYDMYEIAAPDVYFESTINYDLYFNVSQDFARRLIVEDNGAEFFHMLSRAQSASLFPALETTFDLVRADYRQDGTLIAIQASRASIEWVDYNVYMHPRIVLRISNEELTRQMILFSEYDVPLQQLSYVHGVPVLVESHELPVIYATNAQSNMFVFVAYFEMDGVHYILEVVDYLEQGMELMTIIVNQIVVAGAPDLSPHIYAEAPVWGNWVYTHEEALLDPIFGHFVPDVYPSVIRLSAGYRTYTMHDNSLLLAWQSTGSDIVDIHWTISNVSAWSWMVPVSVEDRALFDWSYYVYPPFSAELSDYLAGTEASRTLHNPLFAVSDLSLDLIRTRYVSVEHALEAIRPVQTISFSVLYDDIMISISARGATPELIWEMFNNAET